MSISAPCDWPIAYPVVDPEDPDACDTCAALENLTEEQRELVEEMAVSLLWAWTGRKFGLCETTVRPCRAECPDPSSTFWGPSGPRGFLPGTAGWTPALISGEWFNIGCGLCGDSCRCAPNECVSLVLPAPVESIVEIRISGEVLAPESYYLRDGVLYRVDGECWPLCNDQAADPLAPDSPAWTITYMRGYPVPAGGQLAAYSLACELAKALCKDKTCQLPQRVQSVTRQGVTVAVLDSFEDVQEGRTGIWTVDAWVASIRAPKPIMPKVYSPDIERGRGTGLSRGLGMGRTR